MQALYTLQNSLALHDDIENDAFHITFRYHVLSIIKENDIQAKAKKREYGSSVNLFIIIINLCHVAWGK